MSRAAYESGASALYKDEDIQAMIDKLDKHHSHSLFSDIVELGVNVGLRIADLLSIEMEDERLDLDRGLFTLTESKTGKEQITTFPQHALKSIIERRKALYPNHRYLFQSPSNRAKKECQPVSVRSVNRALQEASKSLGLEGSYSSHSLRKGMATRLHLEGVEIEMISKILNHSSVSTTLIYLDIGMNAMLDTRRKVAFSRAA
jgi:integrase